MKKVYYIGYFVEDEYTDSFFSVLSGKLKMKYIYEKLVGCGFDAQIISLCHKEKPIKTKSNRKVKYYFSIPIKNKYAKFINIQLIKFQLLFTYLFKIRRNDVIVLYHSFVFTRFFSFLKRLKKIPIVIEIEEIYGYSAHGHLPHLNKELSYVKSYDKAILVNDYIPRELGYDDKSYVVSYGVCSFDSKKPSVRFNDGKIHAIYAGTLQENKAGALSAARAAEYLPDNYSVDIFGYGSEEQVERLIKVVDEVNARSGCEKVRYMGGKNIKELELIFGMYDIGLSTNIIDPDFANNTFPSKIITYMSHGLSIVSGYAEAFDGIELSKKWSFFYEHTPKAIAEAIVNYKPCTQEENQQILRSVDDKLILWLKQNI